MRKPTDQLRGELGIERRFAAQHLANRGHHLASTCVFEDVASRANPQRLEQVIRIFGKGHDQDADAWQLFFDRPRCHEAIDVGHADVHEHQVRLQPARQLDGFAPGGGLADHFEVRLGLEHRPESKPRQLVIIGDDDPTRAGPWRRAFRRLVLHARPPLLPPARAALRR